MGDRWFAIFVSALLIATLPYPGRVAGGAGPTDVTKASPDAGAETVDGGEWIPIAGQRTTVVHVEQRVGRPIEREPEFLSKVPSYRRAIEMDRDQRWADAAGFYQQALIEIGATVRFDPTPLLEQATFKTDLERRRSRTLAQALGADPHAGPAPGATRVPPDRTRMSILDRARLLRQKLMAVRSVTGVVPGGLVSATLAALGQALRKSDASDADVHGVGKPRARGGDPEVRLLLCATRAVAGDRTGARLEQAHVSRADRLDPTRALAFATCQAALGYHDQALAALAVALHRLGPSPRFLPGQTRELQSANDWDPLRADPRFERLFR